jgi:hypothetical protein
VVLVGPFTDSIVTCTSDVKLSPVYEPFATVIMSPSDATLMAA